MSTVTSPLQRTRYLIARSDTFRAWVGATEGSEQNMLSVALARTHPFQLTVLGADIPAAVVEFPPGARSRERIATSGGAFTRETAVHVTLLHELDDSATADPQSTQLEAFDSDCEAIIDDMCLLSGASNHIYYDRVAHVDGPFLNVTESREQWMISTYKFSGIQIGSQTE